MSESNKWMNEWTNKWKLINGLEREWINKGTEKMDEQAKTLVNVKN